VIALRGAAAEGILSAIFRPRRAHCAGGAGVLQLGHVADRDGRVLDEAVVLRSESRAEINIHGGPAAARAVLERLPRCGAIVTHQGRARPVTRRSATSWRLIHDGRTLPSGARCWRAARAASERVLAVLTAAMVRRAERLAATTLRAAREASSGDRPRVGGGVAARSRGTGTDAAAAAPCGDCPRRAAEFRQEHAGQRAGRPGGQHRARFARTTRDWVREPALLDGVPVWITDTAGLPEAAARPGATPAQAEIDAEAVRRAHQRLDRPTCCWRWLGRRAAHRADRPMQADAPRMGPVRPGPLPRTRARWRCPP